MMKVSRARILLVAALAAVFSACHTANAYKHKVDSEQRRLFGWSMTAEDRGEKYLSIYCRCCGNDEGARKIADRPECEVYAEESCRCPGARGNRRCLVELFQFQLSGSVERVLQYHDSRTGGHFFQPGTRRDASSGPSRLRRTRTR